MSFVQLFLMKLTIFWNSWKRQPCQKIQFAFSLNHMWPHQRYCHQTLVEFQYSIISSPEPWLIGKLIVYPWIRRPSSAVRPFTMVKHLLLRNRLADQSQILCGASLGRGNDILFAASGSHDQDGRHAHIW